MNSWAGLPVPTPENQVGGHEGVGTVVKLGPGTETGTVKVGDRVGIKWIAATCDSCTFFVLVQDFVNDWTLTLETTRSGLLVRP